MVGCEVEQTIQPGHRCLASFANTICRSIAIVCPHADNLYRLLIFNYLINQTVLNVEAASVETVKLPIQFLVGRFWRERLLAELIEKSLRPNQQTGISLFFKNFPIINCLARIVQLVGHYGSVVAQLPSGVFNPSNKIFRIFGNAIILFETSSSVSDQAPS